jgi:hypothetical protein
VTLIPASPTFSEGGSEVIIHFIMEWPHPSFPYECQPRCNVSPPSMGESWVYARQRESGGWRVQFWNLNASDSCRCGGYEKRVWPSVTQSLKPHFASASVYISRSHPKLLYCTCVNDAESSSYSRARARAAASTGHNLRSSSFAALNTTFSISVLISPYTPVFARAAFASASL